MPFEIRHESPEYLAQLNGAAAEIGKRQREAGERDEGRQDRALDMQEKSQEDVMQRFFAQMDQQQEADLLSAGNALSLQELRNKGGMDEANRRYGYDPNNPNSTPYQNRNYTPQQKRQAAKWQDDIQRIMQAKNLRPVQKQQMIQDKIAQINGLTEIPGLPQQQGPSAVQQSFNDNVMPMQDGSGWWVTDPKTGKMDKITRHEDLTDMYKVAKEVLTIVGDENTATKYPTGQEVNDYVNNVMLATRRGEQGGGQVGPQGQPQPQQPQGGQPAPGQPPSGFNMEQYTPSPGDANLPAVAQQTTARQSTPQMSLVEMNSQVDKFIAMFGDAKRNGNRAATTYAWNKLMEIKKQRKGVSQ